MPFAHFCGRALAIAILAFFVFFFHGVFTERVSSFAYALLLLVGAVAVGGLVDIREYLADIRHTLRGSPSREQDFSGRHWLADSMGVCSQLKKRSEPK